MAASRNISEASTLITTTTQQRRRNTAFVIQRQEKRRRTRSGCRQEISRYLQHGLWLNLDTSVVKNFSAMFFTTPLTRRDPSCASFPPTAPRLHTLAGAIPCASEVDTSTALGKAREPPNLRPEFDSRYWDQNSLNSTLPVKRAFSGPTLTRTVAINSVSESIERVLQPGIYSLRTSESLSTAHTALCFAGNHITSREIHYVSIPCLSDDISS